MKIYLKKSEYNSVYKELVKTRVITYLSQVWDTVLMEDEFIAVVLNSELSKTYTKQSLIKFAECSYNWYYDTMRWILLDCSKAGN